MPRLYWGRHSKIQNRRAKRRCGTLDAEAPFWYMFGLWFVELNKDLALRVLKAPFWCAFLLPGTSTKIWHLGCSKHRSGTYFGGFGDVDLNGDVAPQVLRTPFWCNLFMDSCCGILCQLAASTAGDHNTRSTSTSGFKPSGLRRVSAERLE